MHAIRIKTRKHFGYLIFAEDKINRLWQVEDEAALFFLSALLANYFTNENKNVA